MTSKQLPYRDNVCCLLFQDDLFLLVQLIGWPKNLWKFIQGGIEDGESSIEAVKRELLEEIGITNNIRIIAESKYRLKYDWSEDSVKLAGNRWRGQIQRFILVEFFGKRESIQVNTKELKNFKWVSIQDLLVSIDHDHPNFKGYRKIVEKVLFEFGKM